MKQLFYTLMALTMIIFTGCQATVNTLENKDKQAKPTQVDTSKISLDSFLNRRLKILQVNKVEGNGGLLKVQVTAQNVRTGIIDQISTWVMGDNPYKIVYRFTWLDNNGMEVETATKTWIPIEVIPGDIVRLSGVAPNPKCKDFNLSVREDIEARE